MRIEEYIKIVKDLQKEGISETIICRILEEYGKDLRTENMEKGKDKRVGLVEPNEYIKKQEKRAYNSPNQSKEASNKPFEKATEKQLFYLNKNKIEHKENITKKEATQLIKEHKDTLF